MKLRLFIFVCSLIYVHAADCFSDSKWPKLLGSRAPSGDSLYYAVVGTDTEIFVGGGTNDTVIASMTYGTRAVIARVDIVYN